MWRVEYTAVLSNVEEGCFVNRLPVLAEDKMSTPNKKTRKPSTNSALTSADMDLIAKIVSNLEKFLKLKSEENATL